MSQSPLFWLIPYEWMSMHKIYAQRVCPT